MRLSFGVVAQFKLVGYELDSEGKEDSELRVISLKLLGLNHFTSYPDLLVHRIMVLQRRCQYGNGEDYFAKNWNEYKNGFGNIKKEFWLGNDKIHSLTNQGQYSTRFDMRNENRTSAFAVYENFWIGNEESKYRIHLSEYSGTAGDSLSTHSGGLFYTADQPNLPSGKDGKTMRSGGWWLNMMPSSSFNGLNLLGTDRIDSKDGISWKTFGGYDNSLATETICLSVRKSKTDSLPTHVKMM
ncbi:Techylectin-5A [Araneus ventricosus]|uniref:Techylectin-5A n=1 Tax=Araneus ventricosus TaxID=182803 RepID=A0A4Y2NLN2_ARAVE|nr:Techylectin-5A [Araneus ventricosus]